MKRRREDDDRRQRAKRAKHADVWSQIREDVLMMSADTYRVDALKDSLKSSLPEASVQDLVAAIGLFESDTYRVDALKALLRYCAIPLLDSKDVAALVETADSDTYRVDMLKAVIKACSLNIAEDYSSVVGCFQSDSYRIDGLKALYGTVPVDQRLVMQHIDSDSYRSDVIRVFRKGNNVLLQLAPVDDELAEALRISAQESGSGSGSGSGSASASEHKKVVVPPAFQMCIKDDIKTIDCDENDSKNCLICLEYGINTVMRPCGHMYLCVACGKKMKEITPCAKCREPVTEIAGVFVP